MEGVVCLWLTAMLAFCVCTSGFFAARWPCRIFHSFRLSSVSSLSFQATRPNRASQSDLSR